MTETRARQILRENGVWDSVVTSRPSLMTNMIDALMQAVAEEREACAKIADAAFDNSPDECCAIADEIARKIRARDSVAAIRREPPPGASGNR